MSESENIDSCRFTASNPAAIHHVDVVARAGNAYAGKESAHPRHVAKTPQSARTTPPQDAIVAAALTIIENSEGKLANVSTLVNMLQVSRRSLEERFRAQLGRSILEELTRRRVLNAQRVLLNTDLSIPEAARLAGFSDERCMLRAFQSFVGVSPRTYRRQATSPTV